MYERILRNSISMVFWFLTFLVSVALEVVLFSVTYLSFRISCQLMGYENVPLGKDELIGWFFRTFLTDATVAHLFAISLSGVNTVGLFLLFYLLFDCLELLEDKRSLKAALQEENAKALNRPIRMRLIIMALILVLLIPAFALDLASVRFRIINGVEGNEYPEEATKIDSWDKQIQENGNKMAWGIARISIWGYLAINILGGVISAYVVHKLSECWVRLWDSFRRDPIPPPGAAASLDGKAEVEKNVRNSQEEPHETPDNVTETQSVSAEDQEPGSVPPSGERGSQAGSPDLDEMVDVVGSDERVTLSQARSRPDLLIDPETGTVWDKEFRSQIMGEQSDE